MAEPTYQRLTRTRTPLQFSATISIRSSLWLGDDHLLLVDLAGYRETYRRFYFRDIQAITVLETTRRAIGNAILGVPAAVCLIGVIASAVPPGNLGAMIVWSIFETLFLLPFVINNIRGMACACQIRTAVQTWDLASLSRVRQTRKVLEKIRPLIVAAQGQLTAEEVSARMQEAVSGVPAAPKPEPPPPAAPPIIS